MARIGRNQPCPCGSGKKYKKCCYEKNNLSQILANGFGKNLPKDVVITTNTQNDKNEREIAREILSKMLERKEKKFPDIKRMIMDFQISYKDGQHHLDVISSTNK